MAVYVVTGKLGSGKTLVAVKRIQEYLEQGRMIATNLDLKLEHLVQPFAKSPRVIRVPDKPTAEHLEALPAPYEGDYDERKTGLLVFDECATWFNSRSWSDKGRKALIDWLLHARKRGWDIIFIIQNVSMMDSQAREGFAEHVVHCRRLDRLAIPILTWFFKIGGINFRPPKLHWGIVKYGASDSAPLIERWYYSGTGLYNAYDTTQVFSNDQGMSTVLPPWYIYGRYTNEREHRRRGFNRAINKLAANCRRRPAFFLGLLIGSILFWLFGGGNDAAAQATTQQAAIEAKKAVSSAETGSHPLDGVRITGSVKSRTGFDYIFETESGGFYPENLGYRVRWISECRAALVNGNSVDYVSCSPHRANDTAQTREGSGGLGSEVGNSVLATADTVINAASSIVNP